MMVYSYRYSTVHLATVVLLGCVIALATLLFSSVITFLLLLSCVSSFVLATVICYHPYGGIFRQKFTELLLLSIAVYTTKTRNNGGSFMTTNRGHVSTLIHNESQKIVRLVVRDFVITWYSTVSNDKQLPRDVIRLLQHIALELYFRLQIVDVNDLIIHILPVINPFLSALNEVGYTTLSNSVPCPVYDINHPNCVILFEKNPRLTHPALKSSDAEIQYLQKLVDSYLISAVPTQYLKCDVGLQLIRNSLVYRLIKPLFDLLCDPIFLVECIPLILSKLLEHKVEEILTNIKAENSTFIPQLSDTDGMLSSIIDTAMSNTSNTFWEECDDNESEDTPVQLVQSVSSPCEEIVHIPLPSVYISRYVSVDNKDGVHVGYIIKFPKDTLDEEQLISLDTSEAELEGLKRFSEFIKFHKQLLKSDMNHLVRDAQLPEKRIMSNLWSKVSLSDVDPAVVLERKEGLDKYIQNISSIDEVRNSPLFKSFLFSGVSVLQEACIVSKTIKQSTKRSNADTRRLMYEDKPHTDIEHILEVFLDTQMLLPCHDLLSCSTSDIITPTSATSYHSAISNRTATLLSSRPPNVLYDIFVSDYAHDDNLSLQCDEKAPLFSCLMSLANDATRTTIPELWLTNAATQFGFVNVIGESIDKYLWQELQTIVSDEIRWVRLLYNLRHTLWPNGKLLNDIRTGLTDQQKDQLRNEAVTEIKEFLPNIIPVLIGTDNYDKTVHHCLDSIQNPRINRHFLYHVVDLIFNRVVPEFSDSDFQQHILKLRSRPLFTSKNLH